MKACLSGFIPLVGDQSTFQSIVSLLGDSTIFSPPVVITNFDYCLRVDEQLKDIGAEATDWVVFEKWRRFLCRKRTFAE